MSIWADLHKRGIGELEREEDVVYGTWDVYRCERFKKFSKMDGRRLDESKIGKVGFYGVYVRVMNDDFSDDSRKHWNYYKFYVVMDQDQGKDVARKIVEDLMKDVIKENGRLDPVIKDGKWLNQDRNKQIFKELAGRLSERNKQICFS